MYSGMFISADGHVRLCCVSMEPKYNKQIHIDNIENFRLYIQRRKTTHKNGCMGFRKNIMKKTLLYLKLYYNMILLKLKIKKEKDSNNDFIY